LAEQVSEHKEAEMDTALLLISRAKQSVIRGVDAFDDGRGAPTHERHPINAQPFENTQDIREGPLFGFLSQSKTFIVRRDSQ